MIVLKTQAFAARDLTTANGITILTSDAMPGSPAIHNVGAVIRIGSGEGGANDLHADARILSLWLLLDGVPASRFDFTPRFDTPEVQDVISMPPFPVLAGQVATLKLFSTNANDTAVKVAADLGSHDLDYFHTSVVPAVNVAQINSSTLAAQVLAAEKYEYKDDAVVVVADGATDAARGVNLATAYTAAKALTPGGAALSHVNRACVLIPPGHYDVAAVTLVLDTEYVDLIALKPEMGGLPKATDVDESDGTTSISQFRPPPTVVYSATNDVTAVEQAVQDVRLTGFAIAQLSGDGSGIYHAFYCSADDNTGSRYDKMYFWHKAPYSLPAEARVSVYFAKHVKGTWRDCIANRFAWRLGTDGEFSAQMFDCYGGGHSFMGDLGEAVGCLMVRCKAIGTKVAAIDSGFGAFGGCSSFGVPIDSDCVFVECEAGSNSFGLGVKNEGTFIRCRGRDYCFGATTSPGRPGEFAGYAEDCVARKGSFGGRKVAVGDNGKCTGTLVRCISRGSELAMRLEGATLEGCLLTTATVDEDGVELLDSLSRIADSTILVVEGGTGIPINDDGSARSVAAAGNRFNNLSAAPLGLGLNVTNLGLLDKIDATVASRLAAAWATGITSAAAWLRGLFRKSAMDATAKGEVNVGGGTFNETTDSEEALGEKTTAIKAKTDKIGAAELTAVSPVLADGDLEIVQSDDYMEADGRALEWTDDNYTGPIEDGDDAEFALMETADYHAAGGTPALTKAGTAHLVGTTLRIVVELTAAETSALEPSPPDDRMNYTYQVRVDIGSSGSGERQVTAALGSATVKKKVVA